MYKMRFKVHYIVNKKCTTMFSITDPTDYKDTECSHGLLTMDRYKHRYIPVNCQRGDRIFVDKPPQVFLGI